MTNKEKLSNILFIVFMALFMAGTMSFFILWVNMGMGPMFWPAWLKSWALGFVIGIPTASIVVPLIRALIAKIIKPDTSINQ